MDTTCEKVQKTSRGIAVASHVGCILIILAELVIIFAFIIISIPNSTLAQSLQQAFTITAGDGQKMSIASENLRILFFNAIILLIPMFAILLNIYYIFNDISKEYTPFEKRQVVRIKRVAILAFIMSTINSISDYSVVIALQGKATFRIDIVGIIFAIIIYCIAYIFDYGCQLQRQSDETL